MRHNGVVVQYNSSRGYGFLEDTSDEGINVFFHVSQVPNRRTLKPGTHVSFMVSEGTSPEKLQALDLHIWNDEDDTNDRHNQTKS